MTGIRIWREDWRKTSLVDEEVDLKMSSIVKSRGQVSKIQR